MNDFDMKDRMKEKIDFISSSDNKDFSIPEIESFTVEFHLGDLCNYNCSYCLHRNHKDDCLDDVIPFFKRIKEESDFISQIEKINRKVNIGFMGGEPTMYPLKEIIDTLSIHKVSKYTIITNLSKDKAYFENLINTIDRYNENTILSLSCSFHEEFTTKEKFIERFLEISTIRNIDIRLAPIVVTQKNYDICMDFSEYFHRKVDLNKFNIMFVEARTDRNNHSFTELTEYQKSQIRSSFSKKEKSANKFIHLSNNDVLEVPSIKNIHLFYPELSVKDMYCSFVYERHHIYLSKNGNVSSNFRCGNIYLGNLFDGTYDIDRYRYSKCLYDYCPCFNPSLLVSEDIYKPDDNVVLKNELMLTED